MNKFINIKKGEITFDLSLKWINSLTDFIEKNDTRAVIYGMMIISVVSYLFFYNNGLGLAYNDARSHLNIGRRVVEGLKPGLAQLGSVWLPLPHFLMVPTVWIDSFWHSGLAGGIISMASFVLTGSLIYIYLKKLGVGLVGRVLGILAFVLNINILYLQSTAMTELLLMATMTAGVYYLINWHGDDNILNLIKSAFWIMLSTLVRYDGWFLLIFSAILVAIHSFRRKGYKFAEGSVFLYLTLGAFGIVLWLLWNLLIFNDPLYFAFGPFSAHSQQLQLLDAGELPTKSNLLLSIKTYFYALAYNSYTIPVILSLLGVVALIKDDKVKNEVKLASTSLFAPLFFNILALYLGHSVLMVQGISGNTWFNVRYGIMLLPTFAIFIGLLLDRVKRLNSVFVGAFALITFFAFVNFDAVTVDDARYGSSQKNVSEVSAWLNQNAKGKEGFVLISAASHDAIIFSSGLPMSKFIHEGTGLYWDSALVAPDKWARWIVMRSNDDSDMTYRELKYTYGLTRYELVDSYPFADIYELKAEYLGNLNTEPVFKNHRYKGSISSL